MIAVGWTIDSSGNYSALAARWNGTAFVQQPAPAPGLQSELEGVAALAPGNVWAAGDYVAADGSDRTLVEHYNGSGWSVVPSPNVATACGCNFLIDIAGANASDLWSVGGYYNNDGVERTLTEHYNGSTWSIMPSPNVGPYDNFLNGVAMVHYAGPPTNGQAFAVGGSYLDPYDNSSQPLMECYC